MVIHIFIGTSGWNYDWNKGKSLEWYIENTKFNAIELNYSFYHIPTEKSIKSWITGNELSWSVKVNRVITHTYRLNEKSIKYIKDFINLFDKSALKVDNFLFQLPPSFTAKNADRVINISKLFDKSRLIFEARNLSFFKDSIYKKFKENGITLASIDSPLGNFYVNTTGTIYLRLHGRKNWYSYNYLKNELSDILESIIKLKPKKIYIFFNNVYMFQNCNLFINLVKEKYGNILYYR